MEESDLVRIVGDWKKRESSVAICIVVAKRFMKNIRIEDRDNRVLPRSFGSGNVKLAFHH